MPPAWRLAINSLSARRNRSLLLIASVALSAALVAAVSCAMASITSAVRIRLDQTVGRSDLRIKPSGTGGTMPASILPQAQQWPEVTLAAGRLDASSSWRFIRPYWSPDTADNIGGDGFIAKCSASSPPPSLTASTQTSKPGSAKPSSSKAASQPLLAKSRSTNPSLKN